MASHIIATTKSLQNCLGNAGDDWFESYQCPTDGSWDVATIVKNKAIFLIARSDQNGARHVTIRSEAAMLFPPDARIVREMLQRLHRFLVESEKPPIILPPEWSAFHYDNLITYFACRREYGAWRWTAEVSSADSPHPVFWKLTSSSSEEDVAQLKAQPGYALAKREQDRIDDDWHEAHRDAMSFFSNLPEPATTATIVPSIDLPVATFQAVTQFRDYHAWLKELTARQREFLEHETDRSVKLRGPAGTGKTLALQLKALREVYRSRQEQRDVRILFVTHSWALAEQIDSGLSNLDTTGGTPEIVVYPLLSIASELLPSERMGRLRLLGEDSLSGKLHQLRRLADIVEELRQGDWIRYKNSVSQGFARRVESPQQSVERNSLLWDLMLEFSSVLAAHGILPGINAERQYLAIPRAPWMMPLANDVEKQCVLRIYKQFIESLKSEGVLTSDQITSDFLNYLETFVWNIKRESEGYDLIFVDELHLFSEQERLVLHYLTRSADKYPVLFMALDPRQAPNEVYADFKTGAVAKGDSGEADRQLGDVDFVELEEVHRFTKEILALVRHIHSCYPALDLGADWRFDVAGMIGGSDGTGHKPRLFIHGSHDEETNSVLTRARELQRDLGKECRVAVILLDSLRLAEVQESVGREFTIISSRDDVSQLQYTRRTIVLAGAEFVAGLQFSHVIVAGAPESASEYSTHAYQLRRFLSLLYLAVSRATTDVELHFNDESGELPEVLDMAVKRGVVERPDQRSE